MKPLFSVRTREGHTLDLLGKECLEELHHTNGCGQIAMDPQSVAFIPQNESWRLQNDLLRVQQVQSDHSDRLLRLERRQDDDARMKSVWGGASPFPSVLSGTPQQG